MRPDRIAPRRIDLINASDNRATGLLYAGKMIVIDPTPFPLGAIPVAQLNDRLREDLALTRPELQRLIAASSSDQQEVLEFRGRYERLPDNTPLAPRSLKAIDQGRSVYLKLQGRLITLSQHYGSLLGLDAHMLDRLQMDPVLRERAVLTSLAASLALYDNHLSMRTVLKDDRLRRLIANPDRGYGQTEEQIVGFLREMNSAERQQQLTHLVQAYDRFSQRLQARQDPDIDLLCMAVESSAAYRYAQQATLADQLPTTTERLREQFMDTLIDLGTSTLGTLSEVFGNGIGLVELRKGKLWGRQGVEARLHQILEPLDILLEKTPFRLTDKFIPGHFGHVAVWVGTAQELSDMGVLDDPLFREPGYRHCAREVRAGRSVLEALRTGVQLSSLSEFLNVDDLAILRPRGLTTEERHASLIRGFMQVGKQYDFNFEVETIDKVTCSELPYHVFPDIPWETEQQLGQYTISPDQVAGQALGEDAPLRLIDFYHDGRHLDAEQALHRMTRLIEEAQA